MECLMKKEEPSSNELIKILEKNVSKQFDPFMLEIYSY